MPQAAAVIDLEKFRRDRREARGAMRQGAVAPAPSAVACLMPVWVAWVPVWPVR